MARAHGAHGVAAVLSGERSVRGGEEGGAPPAVSPGRPEAGDLALDDGDTQCRVRQRERMRGPQAREAGADDTDVDLEIFA